MTRRPESPESLSVARYVDGELQGAARRAFEARLGAEPALRREVEELRALRDWFDDHPAADTIRPSAGFRQRVLTKAAVDSQRTGAAAAVTDMAESDDQQLIRWSRRVLYAAAAVLLLGGLTAAGLLRPTDGQELAASPATIERAMALLDSRIEAARADSLRTGPDATRGDGR